ncbi:DNA translocase FtsK [Patescibacteria group bacterium]|nr:DNA translocase FtsK [Patescibacteria group bacterium]
MAKDKKNKNNQKLQKKEEKIKAPLLNSRTKRWIKATIMFLVAVIVSLSFLDKAGRGGELFLKGAKFLIGQTVFTIPFLFLLSGLIFLKPKHRGKLIPTFLGIFVLIFGIAGVLGSQNLNLKEGGWLGYLMAQIIVSSFGLLVANIVFGAVIVIGLVIFFQSLWHLKKISEEEKEEKPSLLSRITKFKKLTSLKIKEIEEENKVSPDAQPKISLFKNAKNEELKTNNKKLSKNKEQYILPPIDLLSKNEGSPTSGNIKQNSIIIQKTLENFGISVEMVEANVGPTVTQYAFKPAEGVKLSKITTLTNNLSLALAAHPIRIEAPIPGKSLVGIEVPNKVRSIVSLRNLIADPSFQNSISPLLFVLGRNVSGIATYADMAEMPHLLVAGSTGTGKTIFLNSLILSLLYKNSPKDLRIIMVDPKRVEFQHYNHLPHLLCPVIYDANKTINALNWLVKEMERRFEVFSEVPTRNLDTYNKNKIVIAEGRTLPYIVLIIDELADLMASKGREIEAGVVRLAQMARATGIHLVLATQRPSVEVITGLIKANVSSRATFQVASQIDSRTVLDMGGAEKLLGSGDMLFVSAKSIRPRRLQGPYVPEEDVRKVAEFIGKQNGKTDNSTASFLAQSLQDQLEASEEREAGKMVFDQNDPLFEESKRIILETKKASASFLQRRLKIGYARAARLIDTLEERGIVGPADGAKSREVFGEKTDITIEQPPEGTGDMEGNDESDEWEKV